MQSKTKNYKHSSNYETREIFVSCVKIISKLCLSIYNVCCFFFFSCCCSVAKSCLTPCDPMGCSTPGSSVPHHFPEFAQISLELVMLTISSSAAPFSFCHQSFPTSWSFLMSWIFTSSGQNTGVSFSNSLSNEYSGLINC